MNCLRLTERRHNAFTLIEVLVVVAIITTLVAILIPSLNRAREQARIVACMSNMSNMPKALLLFAADHGGLGQLVGKENEWEIIDPSHTKYAYQSGFTMGGTKIDTPQLKAWPVAIAPYLGITSLRRMEQYLDPTFTKSPAYYFDKFGRHDIFICPSDKYLVNDVFFPFELYGILSYAVNEDILGTSCPPEEKPTALDDERIWKDGRRQAGDRLEGRLDRVIRPSEVALFSDGGDEEGKKVFQGCLMGSWGSVNGPYLENSERQHSRLPHARHSDQGGLSVALADGSAKYLKPIEWIYVGSVRYVKRYTPRLRLSPYEVGTLSSQQP